MKRAVITVLALAVLFVAAAPAMAQTPTDRKIAALQRQVTALTKQVATLKKQVAFANSEVAANYYGDACSDAATAWLFQSTWGTIDKTQPNPIFGTQVPFKDRSSCSKINIDGISITQTPPSVNIFNDLLQWLIGS